MNRQGWKDALYVDKNILNTTQQTRSGGGSKKRMIVPCETAGLTVVIFHCSRHSQCFISQISKCDVSQLSVAISQYSHDRPIFLGSWAQAYLFFTWPGIWLAGCQNYHYPDLSKYSEHRRQWHWRQKFLFRYDELSFLGGYTSSLGSGL